MFTIRKMSNNTNKRFLNQSVCRIKRNCSCFSVPKPIKPNFICADLTQNTTKVLNILKMAQTIFLNNTIESIWTRVHVVLGPMLCTAMISYIIITTHCCCGFYFKCAINSRIIHFRMCMGWAHNVVLIDSNRSQLFFGLKNKWFIAQRYVHLGCGVL